MAGLETLLKENAESILTCVHCGLCLPACPTYRELANENDSPRGRIYLMRAVTEARLGPGEAFEKHIDLCLGCRACETVCPSGVPYGQLLEAARAEVASEKRRRHAPSEFLVRFALTQLFTRPRLLRGAFRAATWLRDSGLARLAFDSGLFGSRTNFAIALLLASAPAKLPGAGRRVEEPATSQVLKERPPVAFLKGCVMEGLFSHVNRATERVICANGFPIVQADGHGCCGALHAHAGYREPALELARRNIEAFLKSGCERVVVNAAGCGAAMKEYATWLSDDAEFAEKAGRFSASVRDISELLSEFGLIQPEADVACNVSYDAPCHLMHAQRVVHQPLAMLRSIPGLKLVPLAGSETCCGGAGIYNLQHPALSTAILRNKVEAIKSSSVELLATGNPGCIMQIGAGLLLAGSDVIVVHPVEVLSQGYTDKERDSNKSSGSKGR